MCGRYLIESEEDIIDMREVIDEINRKYTGSEPRAAMKTGEVFPTNLVPVIAQTGTELMTWGFPMRGKSQTIINARSETVFERAMFRTAVTQRRVVVPTTGFYEWTHEGKKAKDKFLFRLPSVPMLYLAGIYTAFAGPDGTQMRFTILTAAANDSMRPYHDRMPVTIGSGELNSWIEDGHFTEEALRRSQPQLEPTHILKTPSIEQTRLF